MAVRHIGPMIESTRLGDPYLHASNNNGGARLHLAAHEGVQQAGGRFPFFILCAVPFS